MIDQLAKKNYYDLLPVTMLKQTLSTGNVHQGNFPSLEINNYN